MSVVPHGAAGALISAPLRVLTGMRAVFERDFLVFTSNPRFLILRTATVFLTALVIGTTLALIDIAPGSGQTVFQAAAVFLPPVLLLLSPALAAPCIAAERALGTLPIVLTAPVSPASFVLAKYASRLGTTLVLLFGTLPVIALCLIYGGVSAGLFLDLVALCVGCAIVGTTSGMLASTFSRQVGTAVLAAYAFALLLPLLELAVVGIAGNAMASPWRSKAWVFFLTANPVGAWFTVGLEGAGFGRGADAGLNLLIASVLVTLPVLLLCTRRISREAQANARSTRTGRRPFVAVFSNPVLDRGLRGSLFLRPKLGAWLTWVSVLVVWLLCVLLGRKDLDEEWPHYMVTIWCTTLVLFVVMAKSSQAIALERQSGALDLLRTTSMGTRRIIDGKLTAIVVSVLPLLFVPALHGFLAVPFSDYRLVAHLVWILSAGVVVWTLALVGLRFSCTSSTAGRSVLKTFGLVLGGSLAHLVLTGLFVAVTNGRLDEVYFFLFGASPGYVLAAPTLFLIDDTPGNEVIWGIVAGALWSGVYVIWSIKTWIGLPKRLEKSLG